MRHQGTTYKHFLLLEKSMVGKTSCYAGEGQKRSFFVKIIKMVRRERCEKNMKVLSYYIVISLHAKKNP